VSDGARTRDTQDHNLVLYRLSYTHHVLSLGEQGGEPAQRYRSAPAAPSGRGSGVPHAPVAGFSSSPASRAAKSPTTSAAAFFAWLLVGPGDATNTVRR
jgi:hypothetical protein